MRKYLSLVLCLIGCATTVTPPVWPQMEGGAVCQGSKAWRQANVCGPGNKTGLCIRVVEGPILIREIHSSGSCPNVLLVGVQATDPTSTTTPVWVAKSVPMHPLHVEDRDDNFKVEAGMSLFVGTEGANDKVDSSCCYITWEGMRL